MGAPLSWAGPAFRIVDEVHITPLNYSVDQPLLSAPPRAPSCSVEVGAVCLRDRRGHRRLRPQRRRRWDGTSVAG
jgi:hypothetical protein